MSEYGKVKLIHLRRKIEKGLTSDPWRYDWEPSRFVEIMAWITALTVLSCLAYVFWRVIQ